VNNAVTADNALRSESQGFLPGCGVMTTRHSILGCRAGSHHVISASSTATGSPVSNERTPAAHTAAAA
jgi:hypothetical protein